MPCLSGQFTRNYAHFSIKTPLLGHKGSLQALSYDRWIHLIALSLKMQEEHPDRWHQLASAETPVVPY